LLIYLGAGRLLGRKRDGVEAPLCRTDLSWLAGVVLTGGVLAPIVLITLSCILLSWNSGQVFGVSIFALGVLFACTFWGMDNNFSRMISGKDPIAA